MEPVRFYEGPFYLLSNFSAHQVVFGGETFMTSEHAYQAAKFADAALRKKIREAPSAFLAREYGQEEIGRTPNFDKIATMHAIMRAKAQQHADVKAALLSTGDAPIEKNHPDDAFWGTGPDGNGKNIMGKIWMEIRDEFRAAKPARLFHDTFGQTHEKPDGIEPLWRPSAYAVVRDGEGKLLVVMATHDAQNWQFPGGGVDPGEPIAEAIIRECGEEAGVVIESVDPIPVHFEERDFYCVHRKVFYRALVFFHVATAKHVDASRVHPGEISKVTWKSLDELTDAVTHPLIHNVLAKLRSA